jgi:hypothetical protein
VVLGIARENEHEEEEEAVAAAEQRTGKQKTVKEFPLK